MMKPIEQCLPQRSIHLILYIFLTASSVLSSGFFVPPKNTDSSIMEFYRQGHYVSVDSTVSHDKGLLIFFVGSYSAPRYYRMFLDLAASLGYLSIGLMYPDAPSVLPCRRDEDPKCFERMREEIVYGIDRSPLVNVDPDDCLMHRMEALLQYLSVTYPEGEWRNYLHASGRIDFTNVSLAGHSQGAGYTVFIAHRHEVKRVIVFSGPDDFRELRGKSAPWIGRASHTPADRFFGLLHLHDEIGYFYEQYTVWRSIGLARPAGGNGIYLDTVCAETCPQSNRSHAFYTTVIPADGKSFHNSTVVDGYTPLVRNIPVLIDTWKTLLTAD